MRVPPRTSGTILIGTTFRIVYLIDNQVIASVDGLAIPAVNQSDQETCQVEATISSRNGIPAMPWHYRVREEITRMQYLPVMR
jgi:hypothetical protein